MFIAFMVCAVLAGVAIVLAPDMTITRAPKGPDAEHREYEGGFGSGFERATSRKKRSG